MIMFRRNVLICGLFLLISNTLESSAANVGQFWHVTDLHVDDRYSTQGNPDYMCWEVSISSSRNPGMYGDHLCDSPQILIESAIDAMVAINPNPDFIMWTGDDTTHVNDSFFSTDIVFNVVSNVSEVIRSRFPNTPVIPVLGNHDLYPQNKIVPGKSDLQSRIAMLWADWLNNFNGFDDFVSKGSFVANIPGTNISIIAINTLLWYETNTITKNDDSLDDPGDLFSWMDQILSSIDPQRKVYIMGHIPPGLFERYFDKREGFHWYQPRYNEKYIELIQKYAPNTIAAQFFGHHHSDSFRVFKNDNDEPVSYALIAPGVTPIVSSLSLTAGAGNPGIRLISYDKATGEVVEVSTYYLDLDVANAMGKATWTLEYNLKEALNIENISPDSLYKAAKDLKNNSTHFDAYYPVNTIQWEDATSCDEACHQVQYCASVEIDYDAYYDCNSVAPNINVHGSIAIAIVISFLLIQLVFQKMF